MSNKNYLFLIIGLLIVGLVGGTVFGIYISPTKTIYEPCKKNFDGCWSRIKEGKDSGDWVCVNVKNMEYKRALEVCQHEIGHEIFAEICEANITKCFDTVNKIENDL